MSDHEYCYFCGNEVDPEEVHCFGCGVNVCAECDETAVMGSHEPEDHREQKDTV